jgi:hypothetical protein
MYRDTRVRENGCRTCRSMKQDLKDLEGRLGDLEESREFFKSASLGRSFTIEAAIEIMTGTTGGRSLDLIRLAKNIRERYGILPADMLE